jgi:hypothetical protein
MSLAQAMQHLAEGVSSATAARGASLSHLRQDVAKHHQEVQRHLHHIHTDNRHTARALRSTLAGQRKHMASEEQTRQNTARQETEQRKVAKSELHANTHSLRSRARLERKETTQALQEKMSSEINDIHNTVHNMRLATKGMLGEMAADLRGAHDAWGRVKKNSNL